MTSEPPKLDVTLVATRPVAVLEIPFAPFTLTYCRPQFGADIQCLADQDV